MGRDYNTSTGLQRAKDRIIRFYQIFKFISIIYTLYKVFSYLTHKYPQCRRLLSYPSQKQKRQTGPRNRYQRTFTKTSVSEAFKSFQFARALSQEGDDYADDHNLSYGNENDDDDNNSDDSERQIDGYRNKSPRKTNTTTNTSIMTSPRSDSSGSSDDDDDLSALNATISHLARVSLLHIPDRYHADDCDVDSSNNSKNKIENKNKNKNKNGKKNDKAKEKEKEKENERNELSKSKLDILYNKSSEFSHRCYHIKHGLKRQLLLWLVHRLDEIRFENQIYCRPKRIILIRHGESEGNRDKKILSKIPDYRLKLTLKGKKQAHNAGKKLSSIIGENEYLYIYHSPFLRCKQTLNEIINSDINLSSKIVKIVEDPRLREQKFANLQNYPEISQYCNDRLKYGRFFYRFPSGEAGSDVYDRVGLFLQTLFRVFKYGKFSRLPDVEWNVVIITHGMFMRLFLQKFYRWTVEKYEQIYNFRNCQFCILEKNLLNNGKYEMITSLPDRPEHEYDNEQEQEQKQDGQEHSQGTNKNKNERKNKNKAREFEQNENENQEEEEKQSKIRNKRSKKHKRKDNFEEEGSGRTNANGNRKKNRNRQVVDGNSLAKNRMENEYENGVSTTVSVESEDFDDTDGDANEKANENENEIEYDPFGSHGQSINMQSFV